MSIPPPPAEAELLDFPSRVVGSAENALLYRITRRHDADGRVRDVLHFGSSGLGRFDLLLAGKERAQDWGTCYLGTTPIACFVEKFGDLRVIPPAEVAANVLATVRVTREVRLADLCDGRVLGRYGLTAEIWSGANYLRSQEWARALHEAGFGGLLYGTRHDPAGQLRAIAMFGSSSAHPLDIETVTPIPEPIIEQAFSEYALVVAEPPPVAWI